MIDDTILWQTKLLAWVHDPAEKALVLFREPGGHEGGTVAALRRELFPSGIPSELQGIVRQADQWAAAADRPQFPREGDRRPFEAWTQVRFDKSPVLFHPLSGNELDMGDFQDVDPTHLKTVSFDHYRELILSGENGVDFEKTFLSFWRFAPGKPAKDLGALWSLLPADTRTPDHTIWAHLDLVSAFSGAFQADPANTPALLVVSIGPVQGFIAQARTTSDLWAGSHLLSMVAWEAMKDVCEKLGPDSVIFPQLRGVPIVDLWLYQEKDLPLEKWPDEERQWRQSASDANPLFSAALPNKFVAVVPAAHAYKFGETIEKRARQWVREKGREATGMLLDQAGEENKDELPCYDQIERQMADFLEVSWAVVPWSLISVKDGLVRTDELAAAMRAFYPEGVDSPGFLGTTLWKLLSAAKERPIKTFFKPNPGVLYPAIYDLADRLLGAAKSARPFGQLPQEGFRCSLCGEREWVSIERNELQMSPGQREATLWARIERRRPAWARKGEHLCSICTLKRLWPSIFVQSLKTKLSLPVGRYVVSTHTMALATSLDTWLSKIKEEDLQGRDASVFRSIASHVNREDVERAALPKSLHRKLESTMEEIRNFAYRLPTFLDDLREKAQETTNRRKTEGERQLREIEALLGKLFGKRPEAYYGLILMDGDSMGKWVSGDPSLGLKNSEVWHPDIISNLKDEITNPELEKYINDLRPMSPARHMAISAALNAFSVDLSRQVVEDVFKGKLLYSGGDDVLAMVSVDDLLPAMFVLRMVYSGIGLYNQENREEREHFWKWLGLGEPTNFLMARKGHVHLRKRLYRVMGAKATASFGAVAAHHTARLAKVLRELRTAEKRAKSEGRKDAFSITLMKRAGGGVHLTLPWQIHEGSGAGLRKTPMGVLISMRNALADRDMSRRAAYLIQDWVLKLPPSEMMGEEETFRKMLAKNIEYQLRRQCKDSSRYVSLGAELTEIALKVKGRSGRTDERELVHAFLSVAEFLAREGRMESYEAKGEDK